MLQKASKVFLLFAALLLCGCGDVLFHEFGNVDGHCWNRRDVFYFSYGRPLAADECAGYLLSVEARTDASYEYKNLVVFVEIFDGKEGTLLTADTLCCSIYDDDGRREGSTAGALYQVGSDEVFIGNFGCDTVLMRLSHLMESEELCGVSDVGIRLCSSSARGQHQF